ncbi:MAG TPA: hypothetical protein VJM12_11685 [Pyrinomonadaceae bacterium]|nr:hypothetical protein [Pyrinomonadaceae bacterium]
MISSNNDLYTTVQALSNELKKAGEQRWSAALDDAMTISTVPGEILGEIRLQLQLLRATQIPTRLDMNSRIDEALSYLDQILGSSSL